MNVQMDPYFVVSMSIATILLAVTHALAMLAMLDIIQLEDALVSFLFHIIDFIHS